jgi:hypothetical protein
VRFCPTCYRDNIPLCWSYFNREAPQKLDVLRGVPQYLDVFSTDEGDKQFSLRFQSLPIAYKELFKIDAGRLRFTIVVAAENTSPEKLVFEVEWRGKWDDFNMSRIE